MAGGYCIWCVECIYVCGIVDGGRLLYLVLSVSRSDHDADQACDSQSKRGPIHSCNLASTINTSQSLCVCVCVLVCVCLYLSLSLSFSLCVCMCVCVSVFVYVCVCVYLSVCMYVCVWEGEG